MSQTGPCDDGKTMIIGVAAVVATPKNSSRLHTAVEAMKIRQATHSARG